MEQYVIVIEKTKTGYSAFSPDVLGCVAVGRTVEKCLEEMKAALLAHFSFLEREGDPIPPPFGIAHHLAVSRETGEPFVEDGNFLACIPAEQILPEKLVVVTR